MTGTQALLCNPLCLLGFPVVVRGPIAFCTAGMKDAPWLREQLRARKGLQAWRFFRARVAIEEQQLRRFFGSEYDSYAHRVRSGLPFIP